MSLCYLGMSIGTGGSVGAPPTHVVGAEFGLHELHFHHFDRRMGKEKELFGEEKDRNRRIEEVSKVTEK